jgi:hypothetical protein
MLGARRGSGVRFNRRDSKSRVPSLAPLIKFKELATCYLALYAICMHMGQKKPCCAIL